MGKTKQGRSRQGTGSLEPWVRNGKVVGKRFTVDVKDAGSNKRVRKRFYGKDEASVMQKYQKWLEQRQFGGPVNPEKVTLQDYCVRWLAVDSERRKAITIDSYERKLRVHVYPRIGRVQLAKLQPAHLNELYAAMKRSGLSRRSVQYTRAILHKVLNDAVREGIIVANPADRDTFPHFPKVKKEDKKGETIPQEKLPQVIAAMRESWLFPFFYMALATGCRRGELCALRWSNVHLTANPPWLYVEESTQELPERDGGILHEDVKTEKSEREIFLPPNVARTLHDLHKRQLREASAGNQRWNTDSYVFTNWHGDGPLRPSTVTNHWCDLRKSLGLGRVRLHDLRHTHATYLLANGADMKTVQEQLGHSTYHTTANVYTHVVKAMKEKPAAIIGDIMPEADLK